MAITKAQLEKFVRVRNASPFNSNLQFGFDASGCGFSDRELGVVSRRQEGGYRWDTEHGALIEDTDGKLRLEPRQYVKRVTVEQAFSGKIL